MSHPHETGYIVLNGVSHPIQAFTFDELQTVLDCFAKLAPGQTQDHTERVVAIRTILQKALATGGMTEDTFKSTPMLVSDFAPALVVISALTGLDQLKVSAKDGGLGES